MIRRMWFSHRRRLVVLSTAGALALSSVFATAATAAAGSDGSSADCPSGRKAPDGDVCVAAGNRQATEILDALTQLKQQNPIQGLLVGVWIGGKPVLTGALGETSPGVPSTRADNFRIGNTAESMMATILLQMVDAGKIKLSDPVAKWFPDLPEADAVTLQMLATSTSGYADFVTTDEFASTFEADPFRHWTASEIIGIAMRQPTLFAPGTSWAFSDTNFVLLGEILAKASGKPYGSLVLSSIIAKVGIPATRYTTSAAIPSPVQHAYTNERGIYEEATYWSPSWETNAATITSNLADLGKWAQAMGQGTLLSKKSHELQVGRENVGLGPLTADKYYGMGVAISNGWILTNPQMDGYTGIVSYLPSKKASVVVSSTFDNAGSIDVHYAGLVFNRIAAIVSPDNSPDVSVCPRGGC